MNKLGAIQYLFFSCEVVIDTHYACYLGIDEEYFDLGENYRI